jgi:XapX domain-containing protein
MRPYLVSLGAGILVGVVYALLKVRSPAPPVIALVGLLGILIGEQVIPVRKQLISGAASPPPGARPNALRISSACCRHGKQMLKPMLSR